MNCFENTICDLLKDNKKILEGIIYFIDNHQCSEKYLLSKETLQQLMICLSKDIHEEEIWDILLSVLKEDSISDELIEYLIKNEISLMKLCHMNFSDKWLKKLMIYDDAPLFTLAKRYYLQSQYSSLDFTDFYYQYLIFHEEISIWLLEYFKNSEKKELLLYLCINDTVFKERTKLECLFVSYKLKSMIDADEISEIYEKYKTVGTVLLGIANNYFTSENILLELASIKKIDYASEIRKISRETLKVKKVKTKNNRTGMR